MSGSFPASYLVGPAVGMEPFPGYRLRSSLGHGAFGEVWEAESPDGSIVALKFLACDTTLKASKEVHSIQMVRQLRHSNLCHVFKVWCYQRYVVVAMERGDKDLQHLLDDHRANGTPLPPEQVCLLLLDAAAGIDFLNAHKHVIEGQRVGIQHCDIKPRNLLLFGDTVKLCDFGLATRMAAPTKFHARTGTSDYAAPEVFQCIRTNWTDQYSLAVSYCQLRGGRMPFGNSPSSMRPSYRRPPADLSMLSPEERPLVARALDPVPHHRWPSCHEFITQLAKIFV